MPTPANSHGCTWNRLTADDLPEIGGLIDAEEYLGDAIHHHDLHALTVALAADPIGVGDNGVVLRKPSGTLIAYAWVQVPGMDAPTGPVYLHSGCHPAWRHEGVQPTLLDWQSDRAVEWFYETDGEHGPLELTVVASTANQIFADLLPAKGFPPQRWYHALRRSLTEPLPGSLDGVEFVPFGAEWSEPVRLLYNQTLAHDSAGLDEAAWQWGIDSADIRDDLSFVALAQGEAVGWVLNALTDLAGRRSGWTEYLGACQPWRNQGLYQALLARSHDAFRAIGLTTAGIGVETYSDQGARPYRDLGYQPVDTMVWYVSHPAPDTIGAAQPEEQPGAQPDEHADGT